MDEMDLLEEALDIIEELVRAIRTLPVSWKVFVGEELTERIRQLPGFEED